MKGSAAECIQEARQLLLHIVPDEIERGFPAEKEI